MFLNRLVVHRACIAAGNGDGVKATLRAAARTLTPSPCFRPFRIAGGGRGCSAGGL